jgi:CRISPR-associated protein Csb2
MLRKLAMADKQSVQNKLYNGHRSEVSIYTNLNGQGKGRRTSTDCVDSEADAYEPVSPIPHQSCVTSGHNEFERLCSPYAVFSLRKLKGNGFWTVNPVRRNLHLVGMLRHIAGRDDFATRLGWDQRRIASFVLGHGEAHGATHEPVDGARLVFIPLPSLERGGKNKGRISGDVRRVLITVTGKLAREMFARIVTNFDGRELIEEKSGRAVAFLSLQSPHNEVLRDFFTESSAWATVTPVVLPGYDDPAKLRRRLQTCAITAHEKSAILSKLEKRTDALLRKALLQAGYPEEIAKNAELQWRGTGFVPGVNLAKNYTIPAQHRRYRRLHVSICWRNPQGAPLKLPGPHCIGGGRFSGFGLFTALY